jgi:hypothetical protein
MAEMFKPLKLSGFVLQAVESWRVILAPPLNFSGLGRLPQAAMGEGHS